MGLTLNDEDKRKESLEVFIRALQAAPDSFVKNLSGKSYAQQVIDGAKGIKDYLFPDGDKK